MRKVSIDDVPLVGGKNASLGEVYRALRPQGVHLADGFAVRAEAYRRFLKESGVETKIQSILSGLNTQDVANLQDRGRRA